MPKRDDGVETAVDSRRPGSTARCPRRNSSSLGRGCPSPARLRWSRSARPISRSGSRAQAAYGLARRGFASQPASSRSGPRWPTTRVLLGGGQQLDHGEAVADGDAVRDLEDDPYLESGPPRPRLAGPIEVPGAVHPEVRVQSQRHLAIDPGQQVLAARDHLEDLVAGQVGGRQRGHPEVGAQQHASGERFVQVLVRRARRCRPRALEPSARASRGRSRPRGPSRPSGAGQPLEGAFAPSYGLTLRRT